MNRILLRLPYAKLQTVIALIGHTNSEPIWGREAHELLLVCIKEATLTMSATGERFVDCVLEVVPTPKFNPVTASGRKLYEPGDFTLIQHAYLKIPEQKQ
jgi:hypothetical protein